MSFIDISNASIEQLADTAKLWTVDTLPSNDNSQITLLIATAEERDNFEKIFIKWLKYANIQPKHSLSERNKQLKEIVTDRQKNYILVVENVEKLKNINYNLFHQTTEDYECTIILQGDLLRMGSFMVQRADFMNRVLIGVHASKSFE